ncbi:hypothetical protein H6G41_01540 [Tolypothrix sp. FACHB-123]|uniref:hypothetical protein n=1 Tax=Tolypothrix sp. FACHB-123 TaxID=2692868 RepID=UPI001686820F|nr:hypothetical protein [Tolypothrix sp. FACHB-123]MBD2353314.1 hypothetical protein [Tolypothrix sp. FACHB-123]
MTAFNLNQFKFTHKADLVEPGKEIFNPRFSYIDTLRGNDQIIGTSKVNGDFALEAYAISLAKNGSAITSAQLKNQATVITYGIKNEGIINTNNGDDRVRGRAIADISVSAKTVSDAITISQKTDAVAIAKAFAEVNVKAIADGIDNSRGILYTGNGSDSVVGDTEGAISAEATAKVDAVAIVEAICKAPMSEGLTAFSGAIASSIAKASIIATGIKNISGIIATSKGSDTLNASATSSSNNFSLAEISAFASANRDNQALALAIADATAAAVDKAIAIDNTRGLISTGSGNDTIKARASADDIAIAINNTRGSIDTGNGHDTIEAIATGSEAYGIFGGTISTARGNDRVIASSFGGGVNIHLGDGNDFIQGFGEAKVYGGRDLDTISFGSYEKDDFQISFGASNNNSVSFKLDGITMITTEFEQFNFANGSYTYNELKIA